MVSYSRTILDNGVVLSKQLIDKNFTKGIFIKPQYIVIHGTNDTEFGANAKYFRDYMSVNSNLKSSSHYIIDDKNIIQALEDKWRGWHLSDSKSLVSNSNSIGIRLCSNRGNNFNDTIKNTYFLVKKLMTKYNIHYENVIRHYDITGKACPKIIIEENPSLWISFKEALKNNLDIMEIREPIYTGKIKGILSSLNVKIKPDKYSDILGRVGIEDEFLIYEEIDNWYKIISKNKGQDVFGYVSKSYVDVTNIEEMMCKKKQGLQESIKEDKKSTNTVTATQSIFLEEKVTYKDEIEEQNKISLVNKNEIVKNNSNEDEISYIGKVGIVVNVDTNIGIKMLPDNKSYTVGYVLDNQKVKIIEKNNEWYKIIYDTTRGKREGYINIKNIRLE